MQAGYFPPEISRPELNTLYLIKRHFLQNMQSCINPVGILFQCNSTNAAGKAVATGVLTLSTCAAAHDSHEDSKFPILWNWEKSAIHFTLKTNRTVKISFYFLTLRKLWTSSVRKVLLRRLSFSVSCLCLNSSFFFARHSSRFKIRSLLCCMHSGT